MGAGCACHVPTPLGRGDRRHVAPALRGRSGQAWPSSAPAAAFVSASTDRGPPVLPWGQLDPGRGRRPGHPHGLPPQLVNRGRRHAAHRAASAGPHTSAPRRRVEDRPRRDAGAHRRDLVVTTYAMLTRQPGWRGQVAVPRLRVRSDDGEEPLPSFRWAAATDPLDDHTLAAVAAGVSTRRYAGTLDPTPAEVAERGTSSSAVSRRFVALSAKRLRSFLSRPLDELDLRVVCIDGKVFRGRLPERRLENDTRAARAIHRVGGGPCATRRRGHPRYVLQDGATRHPGRHDPLPDGLSRRNRANIKNCSPRRRRHQRRTRAIRTRRLHPDERRIDTANGRNPARRPPPPGRRLDGLDHLTRPGTSPAGRRRDEDAVYRDRTRVWVTVDRGYAIR